MSLAVIIEDLSEERERDCADNRGERSRQREQLRECAWHVPETARRPARLPPSERRRSRTVGVGRGLGEGLRPLKLPPRRALTSWTAWGAGPALRRPLCPPRAATAPHACHSL